MRIFWLLIKMLAAIRSFFVRKQYIPGTLTIAYCNTAPVCRSSNTTTTINNLFHNHENDSASAGSFFLVPEKKSLLISLKDFLKTKNRQPATINQPRASEQRFFELLALNNEAMENNIMPVDKVSKKNENSVKKFLRRISIFIFSLLIMNLVFIQRSFGQMATVNLDYIGSSATCGTDNNYASGSGSVSFSGGIPAGATITNISVFVNLGKTALGNANFAFTLNNVAIGNINGVSAACQSGNFSASTFSSYNNTGSNTLSFTSSGYLGIAGVYNATLTVTYTIPCLIISASAIKTDITCFAANNGTITVSGSGGTSPYMFSIDNTTNYNATVISGASYVPIDNNSGKFINLPTGTYKIRVKDANGCESKTVQ